MKTTSKMIVRIILFIALLILAEALELLLYGFTPNVFVNLIAYALSIGIYIGIFSYWIISIYNRIMERRVRTYLMLIGANMVFWITIRGIKWSAFRYVIIEDRILWYMYYIPMLLLPMLFLFTTLSVGEDEEYRPNKKWSLLWIPTVLLIVMVLTNDIHDFVFRLDKTLHAYGLDYSYGSGYYMVLVYILGLILFSLGMMIRKFSISTQARKASRLPIVVVLCVIIYNVAYIIKPNYGIGYYFIDLTVFTCIMIIAFLESCIQVGLIHSNMGYSDFFAMADIRAQILDKSGNVVYISENALPLMKGDFERLKSEKTMSLNSSTIMNMEPINGGYVSWNSDVSQIHEMIKQLKSLNEKLYKEVDILTFENEQKRETARLEKLRDLHNIMIKEVLPFGEKIKAEIHKKTNAKVEEINRLLFETSMTSTYIKRKVNLILTEQTEKCISTDEMHRAFLESFQLLRIYGRTCQINIAKEYDMSLDMAMFCHDLYQTILDRLNYNFDTLYLNYNLREQDMVFSIEVDTEMKIDILDFEKFEIEKQSFLKGRIKTSFEDESYYISLSVPKWI